MLNGLLVFLATTRGSILDPRNTDWLMRHTDPATSFLGWHFFRQTPIFQAPFGASQNYGMEIGTSVVFTDSIPLLAFFFKPFTSLLPDAFQYFGIWILLSFVLQSVLAYKLLRRFSQDRWLALIGSAFFAIAPVYLARLEGHFALFGQWVVLAGLYLYFAPRFSLLAWLALLSMSALIHFYFLAMVGFIWAAGDLWQRRWRNEITTLQAGRYLLTGASLTLAIMWFAGYFMIGNAVGEPGFGLYRMNLLSMIDPDGLWSLLLRDQPGTASEWEGFNYLGIGMLLLGLLACYEALREPRRTAIDHRTIAPLLLVSLALGVLALSSRVALGNEELTAYEIPGVLQPYADVLRSSGRMFWPVYYLIYLAILVFIFRRLNPRLAMAACATVLAVQVADSSKALGRFSSRFLDPPAWSSPLKSPLWTEIAGQYKRILYVLPRNAPDTFLPWAVFAADHGMAVNFGYFARVNAEKLTAARNDLETAVLRNALERESLYVFESEALWRMASAQRRPSDVVGVVDGFRIIAPNLKECTACDLGAFADVRPEQLAGYSLGERIAFAKGGAGHKYAAMGWSLPEDWGTWSDSEVSSLIVKLGQVPDGDLLLAIEGRAFVNQKYRRQEIDVSVNGVIVDRLIYASPETVELKTLRIPRSVVSGENGLVLIEFMFRHAKSPSELGSSNDRRRLGLGLISMTLSGA
jgi:hypothetical protein